MDKPIFAVPSMTMSSSECENGYVRNICAKPHRKNDVAPKLKALKKSPYTEPSTALANSNTSSDDDASSPLPSNAAVKTTLAPTQNNFAPAIAPVAHIPISVLRSAPWQCVQYLVCISYVSKSLLESRSMGGICSVPGAHGIGPFFSNHL